MTNTTQHTPTQPQIITCIMASNLSEADKKEATRLIAAAAEMLEALKAAMSNLRHHSGDRPDFDEVFAPELSAIARATGQE